MVPLWTYCINIAINTIITIIYYTVHYIIDHRKKHKTLSYLSLSLSVMPAIDSRVSTTSTACCSRGVQPGSLSSRPSLQTHQFKKRFLRRSAASCANSSGNVHVTPTYDNACSFGELRGFVWREWIPFERLRQAFAPPAASFFRSYSSAIVFSRNRSIHRSATPLYSCM